jgi:hypothetical protein
MQSLVCQTMSCRTLGSQDSSVSVVTRLRAGISEVRFLVRERDFPFHQDVQTGSGAHPVSCVVGTGTIFAVVRRPAREGDHPPPSGAEVKSEWW